MSISTYAELQSALNTWTERDEVAVRRQEFISLAEARLNREFGAVETDATLTGTTDSRSISISALSLKEPIALFITSTNGDEVEIAFGTAFPFATTSGQPMQASIDLSDGTLKFDRPVDQGYTFRLRYRQRFALSDAAPTNWLLTNHPDIYLAASLVWGGAFHEDIAKAAAWKTLLDEGIPEVRQQIAQNKIAQARPPSELVRMTGGGWTNWDMTVA